MFKDKEINQKSKIANRFDSDNVLSNELWCKIFRYLTWKERALAARVCSFWQGIADDRSYYVQACKAFRLIVQADDDPRKLLKKDYSIIRKLLVVDPDKVIQILDVEMLCNKKPEFNEEFWIAACERFNFPLKEKGEKTTAKEFFFHQVINKNANYTKCIEGQPFISNQYSFRH